MIVRKSIKGFHIIYHAAHGLLAGKIANEIVSELRPTPWFETLMAITEHDDRQLDFAEKKYLSHLGMPLNFTENPTSTNEILERMARVIKSAKNKSSWVRLLLSYHLEFLYSNLRAKSKKIDTFFLNEEKIRRNTLKLYGIEDALGRDYYEFMRFCDRLSLILCKDETPDAGRLLEINTSINKKQYFISKHADGVLIIRPWIFKTSPFDLEVEELIIETPSFNSTKVFEKALENTCPTLKKWTLIKS